MRWKTFLLIFLPVLLLACGIFSPPEIIPPPPAGTLQGHVTIGPLQPVERVGQPTPTPNPEVFTSRSLNIFQADGKNLVTSIHFNPDGSYRVSLQPGTYVVDIPHTGIGFARPLPKTITIHSGETVQLDIDIDTGIR
jgi:hypothetical protein